MESSWVHVEYTLQGSVKRVDLKGCPILVSQVVQRLGFHEYNEVYIYSSYHSHNIEVLQFQIAFQILAEIGLLQISWCLKGTRLMFLGPLQIRDS